MKTEMQSSLDQIKFRLKEMRFTFQAHALWDFDDIEFLLKRMMEKVGETARFKFLLGDYLRKTNLPVPNNRWVWSHDEIQEMIDAIEMVP